MPTRLCDPIWASWLRLLSLLCSESQLSGSRFFPTSHPCLSPLPFISSLMSPDPLPSTQGLLGDLLSSPHYPCHVPSSFLALLVFALLSHPCPLLSPLPGPLSVRAPRHLPRGVTRVLSPVSAILVYLNPSYPGFPQRPSFCPSDFLFISPAPCIPVIRFPLTCVEISLG